MIEPLESRTLLSTAVRFAVVGDYGGGKSDEADVVARINSWKPNFIITVGDNNYAKLTAKNLDKNIGQYFHDFIYPYTGSYGAGSHDRVNHFFPTVGNHEWTAGDIKPYLDYFTLPGNERYYTFTQGSVQFFALDSDPNEPDLGYVSATRSTAGSTEGRWLRSALAASTATWKIVYFHQGPYSSGHNHGSNVWMQWPFEAWGASAVFSGHDHDYERIINRGFNYFVTGPGGESVGNGFNAPVPGSQVRFDQDFGAMLVQASDTSIKYQFITRSGKVIDTYNTSPTPAAPSTLSALSLSSSTIKLAWQDNSNESEFVIQRSLNGRSYTTIAHVRTDVTAYIDKGLSPNRRYFYRVYAARGVRTSLFSNRAIGWTTR